MTVSLSVDGRKKLRDLLLKEEGYKQFAYSDTRGFLTIGVGHCLTERGLTLNQALMILDDDISDTEHEVAKLIPCYAELDDCRRAVLIDMAFQLGVPGLMQFREVLDALSKKDYHAASVAMLASKWAQETSNRAHQLAWIMEKGVL